MINKSGNYYVLTDIEGSLVGFDSGYPYPIRDTFHGVRFYAGTQKGLEDTAKESKIHGGKFDICEFNFQVKKLNVQIIDQKFEVKIIDDKFVG